MRKILFIALIPPLIHIFNCFVFKQQSSYAGSAKESCFENVINAPKQLDAYRGVANDHKTYLRPRTGLFGLDNSAVAIIDYPELLYYTRLCNNNYAVVWNHSDTTRSSNYIYCKILDSRLQTIISEFRVTEREEGQWDISVGSLSTGEYVVTWKRLVFRKDKSIDSQVQGRIFEPSGKPIGKSFNVSSSRGLNGHARIYGLPDGGFVVLWQRFREGILLRIFNNDQSKRTPEIMIKENNDYFTLIPYAKILPNGTINIYVARFKGYYDDIVYRLSYNSSGKLLLATSGNNIAVESAMEQEVIDEFVYEYIHDLELILREYTAKSTTGSYFCNERSGIVLHGVANRMREFTDNKRLKEYINYFCNKRREICGAGCENVLPETLIPE